MPARRPSEDPPAPTDGGVGSTESSLARTRRARRIDRALAERYPDAHCELDFTSPLELLVATLLSAQTTDVRVNQVTPAVFARYPTAADYAAAVPAELEELIRSAGFYRAKARALIGLGQALVERFDGQVPRRMRDLVTLPGVGRKTANVVLGNAFAVPGLPVDTHVLRVAGRLGLTASDDPVQVESELCAVLERREWTMASHRLIAHGRRTCHARRPACGACAVAPWCASAGIGERDPVAALRLVKESAHVPGQTTSASQLASSRETSSGASSGRK